MPTTGFLGTRADAFIDAAIVFFVLAPFLMAYALRLATQRRHREHRNLQAGLLLAAIVAVLMLEISIRFGSAGEAYAASSLYGPPMTALFVVHLAVAVPTFHPLVLAGDALVAPLLAHAAGFLRPDAPAPGQARLRGPVPLVGHGDRPVRHGLRVLKRTFRGRAPNAGPSTRSCCWIARPRRPAPW